MTYKREVIGYVNVTTDDDKVCFDHQLDDNWVFGNNYFWFSSKGLKTLPAHGGNTMKFWLFPFVERRHRSDNVTEFNKCFEKCKIRREVLCSVDKQLDTTVYFASASFVYNTQNMKTPLLYSTNQWGNVHDASRKYLQGKRGRYFSTVTFGCQAKPTLSPTPNPSYSPSVSPTTSSPSKAPTMHPTRPTKAPTLQPTKEPALEYEFQNGTYGV